MQLSTIKYTYKLRILKWAKLILLLNNAYNFLFFLGLYIFELFVLQKGGLDIITFSNNQSENVRYFLKRPKKKCLQKEVVQLLSYLHENSKGWKSKCLNCNSQAGYYK